MYMSVKNGPFLKGIYVICNLIGKRKVTCYIVSWLLFMSWAEFLDLRLILEIYHSQIKCILIKRDT